MRRDGWLGGVVISTALACGPGGPQTRGEAKAEAKTEAPTKVETPTRVETPTKVEPVAETPKDGPVLVAEAVRPGSATLDGRTIETATEGGWEKRRASGGGSDGVEGLGLSGTGFGGGGRGEGIGGLGRAGAGAPKGAAPPPAIEAEMMDGAPVFEPGASKDRAKPSGAPMKPGIQPKPADGPLKAGSTDDNADFKGFLAFLESWTARPFVESSFQPLDVRDRQFVRVLDGDGQPIPGAQVSVRDASSGRELWRARTYGDGRAPFYPRLWGAQVQASGRYDVAATTDGEVLSGAWDGKDELVLKTAGPRKPKPLTLEVLFLIDTTGSMGDEIAQVKSTLLAVTGKVKALRRDLELRYGAVLYRDLNDDYVTMAYPFTADVQAFNAALQSVEANGGGDLPEAMNQGLDRAVSGMPWQPDAAKVVFLIADAPPQMRQKGDVLYGDSAVQAVGRGIRLHAVAASGLDELGTLVLRQLAQLTRGKFIFIEYGGAEASAARHGVGGPVQSNNLDDIIAREITAEIEGWGRP